MSRRFTSAQCRSDRFWKSSAIAPVTKGAAMLVPCSAAYGAFGTLVQSGISSTLARLDSAEISHCPGRTLHPSGGGPGVQRTGSIHFQVGCVAASM